MRYNPALDGLRAVAITFVILTHSFIHLFPGGGIGVDVFFVLSGYLITSILLNEIHETGSIAWGRFYWRRFLRLTPALAILAAFQFAHAAVSPHDASEIRNATFVAVAYLQNFNVALGFVPTDVIGHTWSLATEEQFYWIWPLALLALARRHPARWVAGAIVAMLAVKIMLWRSGATLNHLQYGPDARPIGLLVGCLLALIPPRLWPRLPDAVPLALLGLLGVLCVAYRGDMSWPMIMAPLAASVACAALIMAAQRDGLTARLLSMPPAVYLGKISYGLYLYSAPICFLGAARHVNPLVLIGASAGAAALSYEYVESPILRLRENFGPAPGRRRAADVALAGPHHDG
jgi:peptidoglycan/LPS O-acetylase OafA/YrhL